jgi:LAO/AO transport system kinase
VPNLGDDVQAVKAGIMEIADVFVVNKADLAGSDKVAAEVEGALSLAHGRTEWMPPILRTIAEEGDGVAAVAEAIARHAAWSQASGEWGRRREQRLREQVRSLLQRAAAERAFTRDGEVREGYRALLEDVKAGRRSPHEAAAVILRGAGR